MWRRDWGRWRVDWIRGYLSLVHREELEMAPSNRESTERNRRRMFRGKNGQKLMSDWMCGVMERIILIHEMLEDWWSLVRIENPNKGWRTCPLSDGWGHQDVDRSWRGPQSLAGGSTFGPNRILSGGDMWKVIMWNRAWHFFRIRGCLGPKNSSGWGLWAEEHQPMVG